jgi:hypothetical protein
MCVHLRVCVCVCVCVSVAVTHILSVAFSLAVLDAENQAKLAALPGATVVFESRDSSADPAVVQQLDRVCPVRRRLELKVAAQVMLMKVRAPHTRWQSSCRGCGPRSG